MTIDSQTRSRRLALAGHGETLDFLETAADTDGERTLVEVGLASGAGNPLHVHRTFAETFEVLEGRLTIVRGGTRLTLLAGDAPVSVPAGVAHRFVNGGDVPCRFRCTLEPGSVGFERAQQVIFGLGQDGLLGRRGMPRSPRQLALVADWMDSHFTGLLGALTGPVLRSLAARARRSGEEERLMERYVRF